MAFRPYACSKYRSQSRTSGLEPALGPHVITDPSSLRAAVPDEVRQFPVPQPGGAPQHVTFDNAGQRSQVAKLSGQSPAPPRSSSTAFPKSYETRDWQSVSKAEFPRRKAEPITAEMQAERKRQQQQSSVPVGLCKAPFPTTTHSQDFLPSYPTTDYADAHKARAAVPGPADKVKSDVTTAETAGPLPGQYTTMTHRQYLPRTVVKADDSKSRELKSNANATHWSFGSERTDYTTVSKTPLPSTAPLVKNRPPSAGVSKDSNMFVARSAAEARPPRMSAQEVAASKTVSTVPLMANRQVPGNDSTTLPRNLTANAMATPAYVAVRRAAADPLAESSRPASGARTRPGGSSGLTLGVDKVEYTSMSKGQFRGAYFGAAPSQ